MRLIKSKPSIVLLLVTVLMLVALLSACSMIASRPVVYAISVDGGYLNDDESKTSGYFEFGAEMTATANVPVGQRFVRWTVDGEEVSTDNPYEFDAKESIALVAVVEEFYSSYNLVVVGGTIGDTTDTSAEIADGEEVTVVADEAPYGQKFDKWTVNGIKVSSDEEYTFTMDEDTTITAVFEVDSESFATVTLAGNAKFVSPSTSQTETIVDLNDSVTIEAVVPYAHKFAGWMVDGEEIAETSETLQFTISADTTVRAICEIDYDNYIEVEIDENAKFTTPAIDAKNKFFMREDSITIEAVVPSDRKFVSFTISEDVVSDETTYTCNLADFASSEFIKIDTNFADKLSYSVTILGGTANGLSNLDVVEGGEITVVANQVQNMSFVKWEIETSDNTQINENRSFTYTVTQDVKIVAVFEEAFSFALTGGTSATENGMVPENTEITIEVTEKAGYEFKAWADEFNNILSITPNYTFILQHNISIKPLFAKITADKTTLTIYDANAREMQFANSQDRENADNNDLTRAEYEFFGVVRIKFDYVERSDIDFANFYYIDDSNPNGALIGDVDTAHKVGSNGNTIVYAVYSKSVAVDVTDAVTYQKNFAGEYVELGTFEDIAVNSEVKFVAKQYDGKQFSHWTVNGEVVADTSNELEMIITDAVEVKAHYSDILTINLENGAFADIENLGSTSVSVPADTRIFIKAEADSDEKGEFIHWLVGDEILSTDREYSLIVDQNMDIVAVFAHFYDVSVTNGLALIDLDAFDNNDFANAKSTLRHIQSGTKIGIISVDNGEKRFKQWELNGDAIQGSTEKMNFVVTSDSELVAKYFEIFTVSAGEDVLIDGTDSQSIVEGSSVLISAPIKAGIDLVGFSVVFDNGDDDLVLNVVVGYDSTRYIPTSDCTINALYKVQATVTINAPAGILCEGAGDYYTGDTVTVVAPNANNKEFQGWFKSDVLMSDKHSYEFTIDSSCTLEARYFDEYTITVEGGKFADQSTSKVFVTGDSVTVSTSEIDGFKFYGWKDKNASGDTYLSTDMSYTFTAIKNIDLTAVFVEQVTVRLTTTSTDFSGDIGSTIKVQVTLPSQKAFDYFVNTQNGNTYDSTHEDVDVENGVAYLTLRGVREDMTFEIKYREAYQIKVYNANGLGQTDPLITNVPVVDSNGAVFDFTLSLDSKASMLNFRGWHDENGDLIESQKHIYIKDITEDKQIYAEFDMLYTQKPVLAQNSIATAKNNIAKFSGYNAGGSASFVIPGLSQGENFVIQGIDYLEDENWMFVTGYISPENSFANNSVIFVMDMTQSVSLGAQTYEGKLIKEILLFETDGSVYNGHAGGIAVNNDNVFVSNASTLYRFSMDKIRNNNATQFVKFEQELPVPVNASYTSFVDGVLWVGEFGYKATDDKIDDSHYVKSGLSAWTVGYEVAERNNGTAVFGYDETTGFKLTDGSLQMAGGDLVPSYVLVHDNRVQGMTVVGNKVVLSRSWSRKSSTNYISQLEVYKNPITGTYMSNANQQISVNGTNVPCWYLDSSRRVQTIEAPSMIEDLAVKEGSNFIFIPTESASYKYHAEDPDNVSDNPVDIVWKKTIAQ